MRLNTENLDKATVPGTSLQFSFTKPDDLGATEYTLVTIEIDVSYSVESFKDGLLKCMKTAIQACQKNPKKENLMLRIVTFNSNVQELHGFIPLTSIDIDSYDPFDCDGCTALYDATYDSIGASLAYAKTLTDMDFDVNGVTFIITDGCDNNSKQSNPNSIKNLIERVKKEEELGSITTILIGINSGDASIFGQLQLFKDEANLDQLIEAKDTSPGTLAKVSKFVSQSVSSVSQSLNSDGASQLLNF